MGSYTVFNAPSAERDPAQRQPDYAIEDHLVKLIDGAPAGSNIHGAMFTWTRTPVADALVRARQRGVNVYLAIDRNGSGGSNADTTNPAISTLKGGGFNKLVLCGNLSLGNSSCIANRSNSINHNKDFTFSATGTMTDVVLVSSQNLTSTQGSNYNNAVVVYGDSDLYQAFQRHMSNMLAQLRDNNYHSSPDGYFASAISNVRTYFSPRADSTGGTSAEAKTDIIANKLNYITRFESGCTVEVAHGQFTGSRVAVADELVRIAALGCKVRIVGSMTDYVHDRLAGKANISIRQLDGVHHKYIIYKGNYDNQAGRTLVFTGSQNLTGPALRAHDETMVRVERPEVSAAYQSNFDFVWGRAA